MRNTFFDVDQDSTIISMLATPEMRDAMRSSKNPLPVKVLLGSLVVFLLIVVLQGSAMWQ